MGDQGIAMAKKKFDPREKSLFKDDVPKMPEGYYSGDKPNPNLRDFVERHVKENPYDPATDDYDVPAFDKQITANKDNAIYSIHGYWSKKPYDAIRQYINHFTKPYDLVLDPFCGSGTASIAANAENRHCIAIDISGAATFITRHVSYPTFAERVIELFELLKSKIENDIQPLYTTTCHLCDSKAEIAFTVWSYTYRCLKCLSVFPIYDAKGDRECPYCGDRLLARSPSVGVMPVETGFDCCGTCRPKRQRRAHSHNSEGPFEKFDLPLIEKIENGKIPNWYPTAEFSDKWISYRPNLGIAKTIAGFFTKRNLRACAAIMNGIDALETSGYEDVDVLRFCFTAALLNFSRKAQHLEEGGGYIPGNYNFPPLSKERNVMRSFEAVTMKVAKGMDSVISIKGPQATTVISTQSALDLANIQTNSIDYIFTDPPYSNKVPFGEFNFLYETWLRMDLSWKSPEELIQNEKLGKTAIQWSLMITKAACEMFRVLKPGRWVSLCYHDAAEGSWEMLQDAFTIAGFIPDNSAKAISIEVRNKSFKQRTTTNVQKRDLVINFRKPKPEELGTADGIISGDEAESTFVEKVHAIIRSFLESHPGSTKDRIYDEVVSRMVRAGLMEAHNFDELLTRVADEVHVEGDKTESSRWYLKETELAVADAAENEREDKSANDIAAFMHKYLESRPEEEGVHYSDLFENYIYAVKDKPRRPLAEFMPDYFYKTDNGTWRLPASEEEKQAKREARAKGLGRRVKRYIAQLKQGALIPERERPGDATLAEWIRHCKRAGFYGQGKFLYEKGGLDLDNLSEEAMVNIEEDYQVCARALARAANDPKHKGRKKIEGM
jgi:DNA modification methylase/DNA-directed RNA polymerase subunit RPC12/RpoP